MISEDGVGYKIGDKVWSISQCYPGLPGVPTGTPYRSFIRRIDDNGDHVWLGSHDNERGDSGRPMSTVHHNLFQLLKQYEDWHINSPIDVTWPGSSHIDRWRAND